MRRIALLLTAVVAFALVQGCGTTNRNQAVVNKPGQAGSTDSSTSIAPSAASSKGGTTAKPGTVTVDLYGKGTAAQSAPTPAPVKKEAAPAPAPAKKEIVKAEPKPAKPAPAPKVEKPAPVKVEKPAPAPKKEVAKSTQTEAEAPIAVSPYSSKGGSAARPGTVTVNLSSGTSTTPPVEKTPPPPKKEKPAPVKKEVVKAEPKPKPVKEAPKKETPVAKPAPAPTPAAEKPVAKVEPAKPAKSAEKKAPAESTVAKPGAKLGMVSQVNNEYKFIVIEFDSEKPLVAGSMIQIVRGGKVVAKAKLEEPLDHWPLATATVIEGTPEKADSVSQ